jgi:hypothetical protein
MFVLSLLLFFNKRNSSTLRGRTFFRPKTIGGVHCPATSPDTPDCSTSHAAIQNAITAWIDPGTAPDTAYNTYLSDCPASQCSASCAEYFGESGLTVDIADKDDLWSDFNGACPLPTDQITNDFTCSTSSPDGGNCATLYGNVLNAVGSNTWSGSAIKESVNAFIASCLTTSCKTTCKTVIAAVNFGSPFNSFLDNFRESCKPVTVPVIPGDSDSETGDVTTEGDDGNGDGNNNEKKGDAASVLFGPNKVLVFILFYSLILQFIPN